MGMWALGYTGAYHGMWNVIGLRTGVIADDVAPTGTAAISAGASGTSEDLPVVTGDVTLALEAHGTGGSELAFVRIANSGVVDEARLAGRRQHLAGHGLGGVVAGGRAGRRAPKVRPTRTPSPSGPPLVPTSSSGPGGSAAPSAAPGASAAPVGSGAPGAARPARSPSAPAASEGPVPSSVPAALPEARPIFVQWRDVAGNWSAPISVGVWYAPEVGDARAPPEPLAHPAAQRADPSAPAASASTPSHPSHPPRSPQGRRGWVEGAVSR
ncbi:MAG: hypothetical protein U0667_15950 [Chloroflexota bacterium]